jgi:phosphoenolpyruvate carboxykinase (ATP)
MNSVNTINELNDLLNGQNVHVQLSVPQLVEKATLRGEAVLTSTGAVKVETGK